MSMTLRPALPDDQPFVFALYKSIRSEELAAFGWGEQECNLFLQQQFAAREASYAAQYPNADHQLMVDEDRPIGRILVSWSDDDCRLVDIALLHDHQNRGLGSKVVRDLLAEAAKVGKPVRLHVLTGSPAVRFYERLGFCVIGGDEVYLEMLHQIPKSPPRQDNDENI